MQLIIQIVLGITALICLINGCKLLLKGVDHFLDGNTMPQPILDNLLRFLSGMYLSVGFLIAWLAYDISRQHETVYLIGFIVFCAGFGRLYSTIKVGSAGARYTRMMIMEILLAMAIIFIEYLRKR